MLSRWVFGVGGSCELTNKLEGGLRNTILPKTHGLMPVFE